MADTADKAAPPPGADDWIVEYDRVLDPASAALIIVAVVSAVFFFTGPLALWSSAPLLLPAALAARLGIRNLFQQRVRTFPRPDQP